MTDAADCPNCREGVDDDQCPHLLAGDACQNCGDDLVKPTAGKVQCPNCYWVVNGQNQDQELRDFNLTHRQAQRFLELFGYKRPTTPGAAGTVLREFARDHDMDRDDLNDLLADLRQTGDYADQDAGDAWRDRATQNVQTWGNQAPATLFLAMVEELGEVAAELFEHAPGPHPDNPDDAPFQGWKLVYRMAELGDETREFLEANFEEPAGKPKTGDERDAVRREQRLGVGVVQDPDAVQDELDDLAPLVYQLTWALSDLDGGSDD